MRHRARFPGLNFTQLDRNRWNETNEEKAAPVNSLMAPSQAVNHFLLWRVMPVRMRLRTWLTGFNAELRRPPAVDYSEMFASSGSKSNLLYTAGTADRLFCSWIGKIFSNEVDSSHETRGRPAGLGITKLLTIREGRFPGYKREDPEKRVSLRNATPRSLSSPLIRIRA